MACGHATLPKHISMNNYDKMLDSARMRFLEYDISALIRPGVADWGDHLAARFLGMEAKIRKTDGQIILDGIPADFNQGMTLYDWLCDRRPDAKAAYEFCPVTSLPGVLVGGKGLTLDGGDLAQRIDKAPGSFCRACQALGGERIPMGDIGYQIFVFPELPMQLKFYHGDEDFPPSLTLLWDRNILQFIRYETIYYLAACLINKLKGMV